MILRILKTAIINIEMIATKYKMEDRDAKELLMCLYHLNKSIDQVEYLQAENNQMHEAMKEMSANNLELMNEIRNRDIRDQAPIIKSLHQDNNPW